MKNLYKIFFLILLSVNLFSQSLYQNYKYKYPFTDGIPSERYRERRNTVLNSMTGHSAMLVFSSDYYFSVTSFLTHEEQNSNLYYLTGIPEQKSVLLLIPGGIVLNGKHENEILFLKPQDSSDILWHGVEMGIKDAHDILKVNNVLAISNLPDILNSVFADRDTLFIAEFPGANPAIFNDNLTFEEHFEIIKKLKEKFKKIIIDKDIPVLKKIRSIKDPDEISLLQKAVNITVKGHIQTIKSAKPGMTEFELEAIMEYTFMRLGAERTGYPSIIGAGEDACILHSMTNRDTLKQGDMVLMDCGAEYHGYTADITRTFPASGKFSKEQKILYNIVLEAQDSAINECFPGNPFIQLHLTAKRIISQRLLDLGIIKDYSDVTLYFPHGTSHNLGLEVHDYSFGEELEPGNVITVEPGIYIPVGSNTDPKWWNIGIRIEDDILITKEGHVILSKDLPRRAEDIENLMEK